MAVNNSARVETALKTPALLMKTPLNRVDIRFIADSILKYGARTLFLYEDASLNVFLTKLELELELKLPLDYGLCVNFRDKNREAVASDVISALETNFKYLFLREPSYSGVTAVNHIAGCDFISDIRKKYASKFGIIVQNCFLHGADEELLQKHFACGADFVATLNANLSHEHLNKYGGRLIKLKKSAAIEPPYPAMEMENTIFEIDLKQDACVDLF
ncbi:MAG: hypothetical protein A2008_01075 [Candidatus Wallbacteria bacterium GWC2_49_35]|uniref:GP-PDE domain-containing protein n=1 Tax=Candidatus Wallbacteria bacterium GWC2_49_35 TaxID=1817813 RepID=A0A1F7WY15_9BACT|nr:MAG: hypothetical protein A2008_01075 [Candidatus Wallbacteria bacterium GWC2_49_35]HBC75670.1 hypothetical protein [Candidatus Wallbacteria bacterium]